MIWSLAVFSALLSAVNAYTEQALADQVVNLPGTTGLDIPFNQFSGYLTVDGTKNMHYWLVESMNDPANDPVAFWTNGGPGCSGLLGFFTEQGPFRVNGDLTLEMNQYAWNKVSNMVFIESPVGVGFSYSDIKDDYEADDASTAALNYALIQEFLKRFPEFSKNSMYISSESYGGHYMPTLAKYIVDQNTAGVNPALNFKGFAVGNPYTTFYSGTPAMLQTYWGHQVIAKPTWDKYTEECLNAIKPNLEVCEFLFMDMYLQTGNLNPYALDYPVCTEDSVAKYGRDQRYWFLKHHLSNSSAALRQAILGDVEKYEPCAEDYATAYANLAEVKKAIHVNDAIEWSMCSYSCRYKQSDGSTSMTPLYNYLIDGGFGLNILVYSGDDDSVCGTIGTQDWIWDLGYEVDGRMWQTYTVNQQTAGYLTKWTDTKLAFLTIHGAGHEVPTYKPAESLDMWARYLNGEFTDA